MKYQLIPRQISVIVLGGPSGVNYSASCQVFIYGDKGFMYSINGEDFYQAMKEDGVEMIKELGVVSLEGYVTEEHERLMRYQIRRTGTVTLVHKGMMNGKEMHWVVVKPK